MVAVFFLLFGLLATSPLPILAGLIFTILEFFVTSLQQLRTLGLDGPLHFIAPFAINALLLLAWDVATILRKRAKLEDFS